jgi:hypothetical protein
MPSKQRSKTSNKKARGRSKPARRAPAISTHAKKKARTKAAATKATKRRAVAKKPQRVPAKKPAKKPAARKAAPKRPAAKRAAPKKIAARKRAAVKIPSAHRAPIRRRDGSGHIDASYAKDLLELSGARETGGAALVDGPHTNDDLAEELGEEAVETMTSGEDEGEDVADQSVPEERGGPFVVTTGGTEFADGVDASNPRDAKREPFPTT